MFRVGLIVWSRGVSLMHEGAADVLTMEQGAIDRRRAQVDDRPVRSERLWTLGSY